VTIATAIFLIAVGAILRYAINVDTDVVNIETVGLILMIAGGAGLALSLLWELMRQNDRRDDRDSYAPRGYEDDYSQRSYGSDDPTRRLR
jgi:hypothetical protein